MLKGTFIYFYPLKSCEVEFAPPFYRAEKLRLSYLSKVTEVNSWNPTLSSMPCALNPHGSHSLSLHIILNIFSVIIKSVLRRSSFSGGGSPFKR